MKRFDYCAMLIAAALAGAPDAVRAQCDTTWEPPNGKCEGVDTRCKTDADCSGGAACVLMGVWQHDGNWSFDAPESGDIACVPADMLAIINDLMCTAGPRVGEYCTISGTGDLRCGECNGGTNDGEECNDDGDCPGGTCTTGTCGAVPTLAANAKTIDAEPDSQIFVYQETTLTLHGATTSTVDGVLCAWGDNTAANVGEIIINDNHTIQGDGGQILGVNSFPHQPIIKTASGKQLTIEPTGATNTRANSVLLIGVWDVQADLVNDAFVIAAPNQALGDNEMNLTTNDKSGSGFWIAEGDATMIVEVEVTGAGKWELTDNDNAEIRIDSPVLCVTGDVEVTKGTFHVNQAKFFTQGQLTFAPPGEIKVTGTGASASTAARARFSGSKPGSCP